MARLIVSDELYDGLYWRGWPCVIRRVGRMQNDIVAIWVDMAELGEIVYIGKNSQDFIVGNKAA